MAFVLPALALFALCLVVTCIIWLLRAGAGGPWLRTLDRLLAVGIAAPALLAAPWPVLSIHLRTLLTVALGLALVAALVRGRAGSQGAIGSIERGTRRGIKLSFLVILVLLNTVAVSGLFPTSPTIDLTFPLRDGDYCVLQGGSSPLTNPFHQYRRGSRHALDIVKLNRGGARARGMAPSDLARYEIFGERVYSPCAGVVVAARPDLPDNPPGELGQEPWGNHVRLQCRAGAVLMAHLMEGSLLVETGDEVAAGAPVARVGNSGLSNEPHLHLAVTAGVDPSSRPLPPTFDGRFLSVNSVVQGTR